MSCIWMLLSLLICGANLITLTHAEQCSAYTTAECDFEQGFCGWETDSANYHWRRRNGGTLSEGTGPSHDHTYGNNTGWYVYAEASVLAFKTNKTRLTSLPINDGRTSCLSFWYHMYGEDINTLNVYLNTTEGLGDPVWSLKNSHGNIWKRGNFTIRPTGVYQVAFEAIHGDGFRGDIALDDIKLSLGECGSIGASIDPFHVTGKLGQRFSLTGEIQDYPLSSTWYKQISRTNNSDFNSVVVSYSDHQITFSDNSTDRPYTASFCQDEAVCAYTLEIKQLTCGHLGDYSCVFSGKNGDCETKFTVSAESEPPVLKPESISGDVDSTVSVLCEANLGYPPGDITWYNIPVGGHGKYRLLTPAPELLRDGDCVHAKSTLTFQLKTVDHGDRIRCETAAGFAEAVVRLNHFPNIPNCMGKECYIANTAVDGSRMSVWPCLMASLVVFLCLGF